MRAMNADRHVYLTTVVLAAVFATAISVLTPRYAFVESSMHPAVSPSRSDDVAPGAVRSQQNVEVAARAPVAPKPAL